jgi:hypothetical protein
MLYKLTSYRSKTKYTRRPKKRINETKSQHTQRPHHLIVVLLDQLPLLLAIPVSALAGYLTTAGAK